MRPRKGGEMGPASIRWRASLALAMPLLLILPCCADEEAYPQLGVTSLAFGDGETIPMRHTCDGLNLSPPLAIADASDDAVSHAIIMDDSDAPGGTYTHWLIWGLPGTESMVAEDQNTRAAEPVRQGTNSADGLGYFGPCPPAGESHEYVFRVYALDQNIELESGATRKQLKSAMKGHIVGYGALSGRYRR